MKTDTLMMRYMGGAKLNITKLNISSTFWSEHTEKEEKHKAVTFDLTERY
jgi:hypothetical protein